jgi:hypothetical protein
VVNEKPSRVVHHRAHGRAKRYLPLQERRICFGAVGWKNFDVRSLGKSLLDERPGRVASVRQFGQWAHGMVRLSGHCCLLGLLNAFAGFQVVAHRCRPETQLAFLRMVPFVLNQKQFGERYRRSVDGLSARAIAELRSLFLRQVPETVTSAEVQVFVGQDDPYVPSAWIYFQGKENKVDHEDPSIFPGRALELSFGLDVLDDFDPRYFSDDEFSGKHIVANILKAWFAECWWKAGGWSYPVPAEVIVHDQYGDGNAIKLSERNG